MKNSDAVPMVDCPECSGQGGHFYDCADSRGEHTTRGDGCQGCDGEGVVRARCFCCAGELGEGFGQEEDGFVCRSCLQWIAKYDALPANCTEADVIAAGLGGQASIEKSRAEVAALLGGVL